MTYFDQLCKAMELFSQQDRAIILGQAVNCPGTAMYKTFAGVPGEKKLEMPVAEDMQMGMSIGMSLAGFKPLSVYPRWNFLLLATNQIVLHLDKLPEYSRQGFVPHVVIRTAVATPDPLDPGPQHLGDYCHAFRSMLRNVRVVELLDAAEIMPAYQQAMEREGSTIIVERTELYDK